MPSPYLPVTTSRYCTKTTSTTPRKAASATSGSENGPRTRTTTSLNIPTAVKPRDIANPYGPLGVTRSRRIEGWPTSPATRAKLAAVTSPASDSSPEHIVRAFNPGLFSTSHDGQVLPVHGKRKRPAPGDPDDDGDVNPRPRKQPRSTMLEDCTWSTPLIYDLTPITEPLAVTSQEEVAKAFKLGLPSEPYDGPTNLEIPSKKRISWERTNGDDDMNCRPLKRPRVEMSDKNYREAQELKKRMAGPGHVSHQWPHKKDKAEVKKLEKARRRKFRPAQPRNPGNEEFFWEKYPEIFLDIPPVRTGCQTWEELRQRTRPVAKTTADLAAPKTNPQVCDVAQLDLLKRARVGRYADHQPEVFNGYPWPMRRSYLQEARQEVRKAKARYGISPGIVEPGSLDTMAQVSGNCAKPSARNDPSKRPKRGNLDPSGPKVLADKHVKRNMMSSYRAIGVTKPRYHHRDLDRWSNPKGFRLRRLAIPSSIEYAVPHPPTSRFEADFKATKCRTGEGGFKAWPRDITGNSHHPEAGSPLRSCVEF
ncbi:MAG: hypothetical protein M1831_000092 [Alyxoria varia]|nr:MAG: hypothetical protein M1831_000092 [Alyxoria varia]